MSFMSGMSAWDKNSMIRGQAKVAERNAEQTKACNARIEEGIKSEQENPDSGVTSVRLFCQKYGTNPKALRRPERQHYLQQIQALPFMRGAGNPHGWSKNAWYLD